MFRLTHIVSTLIPLRGYLLVGRKRFIILTVQTKEEQRVQLNAVFAEAQAGWIVSFTHRVDGVEKLIFLWWADCSEWNVEGAEELWPVVPSSASEHTFHLALGISKIRTKRPSLRQAFFSSSSWSISINLMPMKCDSITSSSEGVGWENIFGV